MITTDTHYAHNHPTVLVRCIAVMCDETAVVCGEAAAVRGVTAIVRGVTAVVSGEVRN